MIKWKFSNAQGNHNAQGFVLGNDYEATRHESTKHVGRFFISFTIDGNPINLWESDVVKFFTEIKDTPAVAAVPLQQTIPSTAPAAKPVATPAATPAVQKEVVDTKSKQSSQPGNGAFDILNAIKDVASECKRSQQRLADIVVKQLTSITEVVSTIAKEEIDAETKDVLIDGLLKLNWDKLQLTLSRVNGKNTIMVVMDGMPPLSVTSENFSGVGISELIVNSFGENALIIESIKSFNIALASKEKEVKKSTSTKAKATPKTRAAKQPAVVTPDVVAPAVVEPEVVSPEDIPPAVTEPMVAAPIVEEIPEAQPPIEPGAGNVPAQVSDFSIDDMP